jgi:hypothetical protein
MKKLSLLSKAILIGFLAAPLQAGTGVYKQVAPPPPPELYGLGFYGVIFFKTAAMTELLQTMPC